MAASHRQPERPVIEMSYFSKEIMMDGIRGIAKAAMAGLLGLLVTTALSAAQDGSSAAKPTLGTVAENYSGTKPATSASTARAKKPSAVALADEANKQEHHLILQVNTNDPAAMNLALNNAMNVTQYYKDSGGKVKVEVVTFGPGLNMLRDDTSPVKARIETMALSTPEISYKACGNTRDNMRKAENKDIPIISQAQLVKSGVIHIMQRQEQGWTYVKP
jgi:uncharacterized protein